MIVVTGRTYELRHFLGVVAGGRFNRDRKRWEFETMNSEHRERLKREPGVMVADIEDDEPEQDHTPATQSIAHDPDRQWQNHFANRNPISFFGFDNLPAMVNFVRDIPKSISDDHRDERNSGWDSYLSNWAGTRTMQEALKLATEGWPKGVELAETIVKHMTGHNALERRRKYSVAGGSVNVGRLLTGNPTHMVNRPKQPGKKIITFFNEGFMSAIIDPDDAIIRAAVVAAITDILETNGFQCEIVSITDAVYGSRERPLYQIVTTLKQAGEPLNISDVVFGLGHPSYFRRLCFAVLATDERMRPFWRNMGYPSEAFTKDHPPGPNEIYVQKIPFERSDIEASTTIERAFKIWDIITEGVTLPINIKRG